MKTKAFQKGHKKVGGRQKGTPNRINGDVRDRILAQVTPEEIISDIQNFKVNKMNKLLTQIFLDNYLFKKYSENMNNNKKRYKKFHNRPEKLFWVGEDRETILQLFTEVFNKSESKKDEKN